MLAPRHCTAFLVQSLLTVGGGNAVRAAPGINLNVTAAEAGERNSLLHIRRKLEARAGIEPAHRGFADLGLTTWLPRRTQSASPHCLFTIVAMLGISTPTFHKFPAM
jgi:hypothetical protein